MISRFVGRDDSGPRWQLDTSARDDPITRDVDTGVDDPWRRHAHPDEEIGDACEHVGDLTPRLAHGRVACCARLPLDFPTDQKRRVDARLAGRVEHDATCVGP